MPKEREVTVSVADSGKGIPPEAILRIFERFYRVDDSAPGHGLGLSMVQSIAKVHNGSVRVESRLNLGTTFYVTLPFVPLFPTVQMN